jgi:hypothetical protein
MATSESVVETPSVMGLERILRTLLLLMNGVTLAWAAYSVRNEFDAVQMIVVFLVFPFAFVSRGGTHLTMRHPLERATRWQYQFVFDSALSLLACSLFYLNAGLPHVPDMKFVATIWTLWVFLNVQYKKLFHLDIF